MSNLVKYRKLEFQYSDEEIANAMRNAVNLKSDMNSRKSGFETKSIRYVYMSTTGDIFLVRFISKNVTWLETNVREIVHPSDPVEASIIIEDASIHDTYPTMKIDLGYTTLPTGDEIFDIINKYLHDKFREYAYELLRLPSKLRTIKSKEYIDALEKAIKLFRDISIINCMYPGVYAVTYELD